MMTATGSDERGPIHGALTVLVEDHHDLGRVMSAVESGRSVLACILDRLDRPLLDDLTEQLVDRAVAIGATVTHVGRPEQPGSGRRRWKRLALALGNRSFLVVPASRTPPDVQVRRLPTQQGDSRTVVGRTTTIRVNTVE